MRLNPFNPGSVNVRRGSGGGGGGGMRAGGLGCGGIIIVLLGVFVFGADPAQMIGMVDGAQQSMPQSQGPVATNESAAEICDDNAYAQESCNALGSLNETWQPLFAASDIPFEQPVLVFYQGGTRSPKKSRNEPGQKASKSIWFPIWSAIRF